jgi:hypothetical protein
LEQKSSSPPKNGLGGILELGCLRFIFLVLVFGLFARRLVLLAVSRGAKGALELKAVDRCVFGVDAPWALLLQELFKLLLRGRLLAPRRTFHSRDEIVWLAFSGRTRKVPLTFVSPVVVVALLVEVGASWKPLPHLFFLFRPVVHHVT